MNLKEEALKIYEQGPERIEELLSQLIDLRRQLLLAYDDVAVWSNRWKETHRQLALVSRDLQKLEAEE